MSSSARRWCSGLVALSATFLAVSALDRDVDFFLSSFVKATSHDDAQHSCNLQGGTLATAFSEEENLAILKAMTEGLHQKPGGAYIGLGDMGHWNSYLWNENQPMTYSNWAPNQPDHGGGPNGEGCVEMWDNGQWNDLMCTAQIPFVCEVPTPPDQLLLKCSPALQDATGERKCHYEASWEFAHYPKPVGTQPEDEAACAAVGGILAQPRSAAHNQWMASRLRMSTHDSLWIGIKQKDFDSIQYNAWSQGNPDHDGSCIEVWWDGAWNDRDCQAAKAFVCEVPQSE